MFHEMAPVEEGRVDEKGFAHRRPCKTRWFVCKAQSGSGNGMRQPDHGVWTVVNEDVGMLRQSRPLEVRRDAMVSGQWNPSASH